MSTDKAAETAAQVDRMIADAEANLEAWRSRDPWTPDAQPAPIADDGEPVDMAPAAEATDGQTIETTLPAPVYVALRRVANFARQVTDLEGLRREVIVLGKDDRVAIETDRLYTAHTVLSDALSRLAFLDEGPAMSEGTKPQTVEVDADYLAHVQAVVGAAIEVRQRLRTNWDGVPRELIAPMDTLAVEVDALTVWSADSMGGESA